MSTFFLFFSFPPSPSLIFITQATSHQYLSPSPSPLPSSPPPHHPSFLLPLQSSNIPYMYISVVFNDNQ
ncbi:hypothetical protein AX774_g750 [Zancudomyces culisetae]|uniref:Uncharacterized protein n=1 Tax=Zancudomyces culisetae TaxID=1213189 RepID=A0A1R1PXM6_ZANCU|nr:hypothetical protein AX774_g750 [Zancudomyces culisetae]|eukprot:OMH85699.1 hypothetical protein AX774_g750 [Zancudomyces culisetae]